MVWADVKNLLHILSIFRYGWRPSRSFPLHGSLDDRRTLIATRSAVSLSDGFWSRSILNLDKYASTALKCRYAL